VRRALVAALASCADGAFRPRTRRFLAGLSCDELQFLAEFLGASILEYDCRYSRRRSQLSLRIGEFQKTRRARCNAASTDQDHKIILLREFLSVSGLEQAPAVLRSSVN
jgi:hypothetical protein